MRTTDSVADDIGSLVRPVGRSPVIVTDSVLLAACTAIVHEALGCDVIIVPGGEPVVETVGALARDIAGRDSDVVVAVGGGSVLDTAKLAARLITDPDGLVARLRAAEPFAPGAAVVALPTTAGSGAEVTRTAIVSHRGHKTWAWDERLRPDLAILAPELTATTPRPVALAAGLDAFCHSVEAATGQRATTEMRALGFEAAASIHLQLAASLDTPRNVAARTEMMRAACAAGVAIDHCGTGIGHAVGHALASIVTIPHGLAVMLGLRAGLEWTLDASDTYEGLDASLGTSGGVAGLADAFDEFLAAVGFRDELARWSRPTAEALAEEMRAEDHQPMCRNNARPIGPGDIETVAMSVVEAWMP
ncbi:MAG: iron-containing alcohol dehydrogenase [Acidimicrobiia bacterium]